MSLLIRLTYVREERDHRTLVGFTEVPDENGKTKTSGNLYIRKPELGDDVPERFTVTIEAD